MNATQLRGKVLRIATVALLFGLSQPAAAQISAPLPATETLYSNAPFDALVSRLEAAVKENQMAVVAQASASRGAAGRGVAIPGNAVIMVFRNDYAVRTLAASVPAGIEAPLRFYVTENSDRTATLTWRKPSVVFGPYGSAPLDAMAKELDPIFDKIARDAVGK
jgi:uncharacterized protein (DUF302 family)